MWRYLLFAISAAGAAMTYPALFQQQADELVAQRRAEPVPVVAQPPREERDANPLAGRVTRIDADRRGHFTAEARLNGRRVEVLVDTGATLVAINETTARRIGLRLSREDFRYQVQTANGATSAAAATIDEITIGRVRVRDVKATVLADEALSSTLLGMSFLRQLKRFEVAGGTLVLTQ